jgi:hypothetical protein
MTEGWIDNTYYIFFDSIEETAVTLAYHLGEYLPGFFLTGIKGWDELILRDSSGKHFLIPSLPLDKRFLEQYDFKIDPKKIITDDKLTGKIRWYIKPLIFGGDAVSEANILWVNLAKHQELVIFWNDLFRKEITKEK